MVQIDAAFSFVVDADPRFSRQGFFLARSIFDQTRGLDVRVFAQVTPEVPATVREMLASLGCEVRQIDRFGDGRYCNKLSQFEALEGVDCRYAVLMDTDMVALSDLRPLLTGDAIQGRIVGLSNPSLAALSAVAHAAGLTHLPPLTAVDCAPGEETFAANLNGGLYVIPRALIEPLALDWRRWTLWLLENDEPLRREGKQHHCDQVGFWLAAHHGQFTCETIPANWNYNPAQLHRSYDPALPIAILHYHRSLGADGALAVSGAPDTNLACIAAANSYLSAAADAWLPWRRC